jgi:hypothetical protein
MTVVELKKLISPDKIVSSRVGKAALKADIINSILRENVAPVKNTKPVKKLPTPPKKSSKKSPVKNKNYKLLVLEADTSDRSLPGEKSEIKKLALSKKLQDESSIINHYVSVFECEKDMETAIKIIANIMSSGYLKHNDLMVFTIKLTEKEYSSYKKYN